MSLRIVFMGTPEFAVPSLRILHEAGYKIVGVITSTDKRGGRGGNQLLESAVKKYALGNGLRILQPPNLKNPDFLHDLRSLKADLQVVVAFRMLPEVVWNMPAMGTINLHGSLLPAYRGAAPINWAIINGETITGVTTFKLKHEIDTGNILLQREIPIGPNDTAGEVHDKMMQIGADVVLETVRGLEMGTLREQQQDISVISHAPKIHHDTCRIDFDQHAQAVHHFIRGLSPFPTAWTILDGKQLNVFRSQLCADDYTGKPGEILETESGVLKIACQQGVVELLEVQLEGKRRMTVRDFLNGYQITGGSLG